MFNNIGRKVKIMAAIFCLLGIVASVTLGFVLVSNEKTAEIGFLILFIGPFSSWLSSLALYAIGQSAENTDEMMKIVKEFIAQQGKSEITEKTEDNPQVNTPKRPDYDKDLDLITIDVIRNREIPFKYTSVLKNVISTLAQNRSATVIKSSIEAALDIIKDPREKKYLSLLVTLGEDEVKDIVKDLNKKINSI